MLIPVGIVKVAPELVTIVWPFEFVEGGGPVGDDVGISVVLLAVVLLPALSLDCDGDGVKVKV